MDVIKIIGKSLCPICSNSEGNFDGGFCCENVCANLYHRKIINDKFVKICSTTIKKRIAEINKKIKDNSHEYKQLELDMLKIIYKHIFLKKGIEYYCKNIRTKLEYWGYGSGDYNTEIVIKEEEIKEIITQIQELELKLKEIKG